MATVRTDGITPVRVGVMPLVDGDVWDGSDLRGDDEHAGLAPPAAAPAP